MLWPVQFFESGKLLLLTITPFITKFFVLKNIALGGAKWGGPETFTLPALVHGVSRLKGSQSQEAPLGFGCALCGVGGCN